MISVCCVTNDPPARVALILGLLRPVAGEILVAVDNSVDESALSAFGGVADKVFRLEGRPAVDDPRPWLASQCTGDWVLWCDGDEVPSPALVDALPGLTAVRDVVQFHIPRRWLFPTSDQWLEETPWWPDYQIRLVRNDPATLRYGGTHEPVTPCMPWRCLEQPLYHLSCLVTSLATRRAKSHLYDQKRPGMVSPGGGPFNEVLQIPEQYATLRPVPVPMDDRPWIDAVLAGVVGGHSPDITTPVTHVRQDEIDAAVPGIRPGSDEYQARVHIVERDTRFAPALSRYLLVRIENRGGATWQWGSPQCQSIHVSYHWWTLDGEPLLFEGKRSALPCTVRPGESVLVAPEVVPPVEPGCYLLEVDLVHEHVRWFGCSSRVEVCVVDRWNRF